MIPFLHLYDKYEAFLYRLSGWKFFLATIIKHLLMLGIVGSL